MRRTRSGPRVLYSFGASNVADNEYLASVLPRGKTGSFRFFSWRFAIFGNYQLFHLHWPELLLGGRGRVRRSLNLALFGVLILRLSVTRTPIIRTRHNLRPHESVGRSVRWSEALLRRLTSVEVFLNESEDNDYRRGFVILHSAYDSLCSPPEQSAGPAPFVFFGLLRPYKGISELVAAHEAANEVAAERAPLVIAGAPADPHYVRELREMIVSRSEVTLVDEFLSKDRLERLIGSASMVVLPYAALYNSGAVLHALSCGRPVLVPATPATAALQQDFGPWVQSFDPPLRSVHLSVPGLGPGDLQALQNALERRSPEVVRRLHTMVYRAVSEQSYRTRRPAALLHRLRKSGGSLPELVAHSPRNAEFFARHGS